MECIVGRLSMGISGKMGGYKSGDHKDSFINTAKNISKRYSSEIPFLSHFRYLDRTMDALL